MLSLCLVFFFKQKTAYEMRISDWSSDVCSSDLFRQQIRRSWFQHAARGMDHRHTVFDGDPLRTVFLHIELRAPQAGKNDRLPGKEQAGSVELGENIDGKVELAELLEAAFWFRHRSEERCVGKECVSTFISR